MTNSSLTQRLAASALLAHVEKICAAGWLPEPDERHLRMLIATMRAVYGPEMPGRPYPPPRIDPEYERALEIMANSIGGM